MAGLLPWMWLPTSSPLRVLQATVITGISAAVLAVVEVGQLLLPTRVPDQTDVYIATACAIGGLWFVRLLQRPADGATLESGAICRLLR